eukprot:GILJ01008159.1.p1 GENE.GILJ01008159.1~~GILJ01008159.1.p1  ORF type:complete len:427 (+),score=34.10 GILJ01008159.1:40-1281(+)
MVYSNIKVGEAPQVVQTQRFDGGQYLADTRQRVNSIQRVILNEEKAARQRFALLRYQNLLGACCIIVPLLIVATMSYLYAFGVVSWWVSLITISIALSIIHEMEHDLIHNLYFRDRPWIQDFMFVLIWISKMHANPWYRRRVHLRHHRVSGQIPDVEERIIGLGLPLGFWRAAVTLHPQGAAFVTEDVARDCPDLDTKEMRLTSLPTMALLFAFNKIFIVFLCQFLLSWKGPLPLGLWPLIRNVFVLWIGPNLLRQGCLVAMSNASHYYEDIPHGDMFYQNQILNHWLCLPFQIFCFNFGSSHIIHHYVPNQPFYLRQLIASAVHREMVTQGVRHNDLGTVWRGNRWTRPQDIAKENQKGLLWFVLLPLLSVPTLLVADLILTVQVIGEYWDRIKSLLSSSRPKHLIENVKEE